jgi:hypothetical protein
MPSLRNWLRRYRTRRHVRPWALSAPIVVLLIALPLLRPLRHPDPRAISDDEAARLATVQSLVEGGLLSIDDSDFADDTRFKVSRSGHWYSNQPPTMSVLLAGSYWVLHRLGHTFASNPNWVMYLLTLLGTTLPVACAAGLVYRMGRLFELHRPWRAGLALAVVLGSGFISYATVLNGHAPAAALVLASAASLIHVTITNRRAHGSVWLAISGACAALAAAFEPAAVVFVLLFAAVVLALRWTVFQRVGGLLVFLVGAAGPAALHVALVQRTTGNVWQGSGLGRPTGESPSAGGFGVSLALPTAAVEEEDPDGASALQPLWAGGERVAAAFVGRHGILSHFPIALLGIIGVTMVMHRHWPSTTKLLASATLAGALAIIVAYALRAVDWSQAMFGTRWFVVFLPLTVFWAGVWLRRPHRTTSWVLAGVLLAFSVTVSLLGATGPLPQEGFSSYTAAGAARRLFRPADPAADPDPRPGALAGAAPARTRPPR